MDHAIVWGVSNARRLSSWRALFIRAGSIGFGIWLAHYGFHFLTGLYTFIPVTQAAVAELGWAVLGSRNGALPGLAPNVVQLFEFGFIALGLLGSLLVSYSIAADRRGGPSVAGLYSVGCAVAADGCAALWLLSQPMEMRGVVLGSG